MSLCILFAMNANYVWLPAYHRIVFSLLLAAAICVGLGQYKMTLDIKTRAGLLQFKVCVIIPFFVMLWARGYVWATEAYSALKFFHDAGDDAFFYGALPLSLLMTLFNLVLIVDVTQSFVKYVILGQRDGGVAKAGSAAPPCTEQQAARAASARLTRIRYSSTRVHIIPIYENTSAPPPPARARAARAPPPPSPQAHRCTARSCRR